MFLGVDVSEYQGEMDWQRCQAFGAQFAYFRVGNGPDDIDEQFERNKTLAPQVLPTGGYWAFHPDWSGSGQADSFCDLLSTWDWKLLPWIDVELLGSVSISTRTKRLEEFVLRMYQRLKVMPVIYTRAEWFNANIYRRMLWSCCELAIARYCYLEHPWGDGYCKPKDWDDYLYWQWSADGNGYGADYGAESRDIDMLRLNGLLPAVHPLVTVKKAAWLRDKPLALGLPVASTWPGSKLENLEASDEWVKVAGWVKRKELK